MLCALNIWSQEQEHLVNKIIEPDSGAVRKKLVVLVVIELRSDLLINFSLGKGSCLQVLKKIVISVTWWDCFNGQHKACLNMTICNPCGWMAVKNGLILMEIEIIVREIEEKPIFGIENCLHVKTTLFLSCCEYFSISLSQLKVLFQLLTPPRIIQKLKIFIKYVNSSAILY